MYKHEFSHNAKKKKITYANARMQKTYANAYLSNKNATVDKCGAKTAMSYKQVKRRSYKPPPPPPSQKKEVMF